jgi:beta-glucosidase
VLALSYAYPGSDSPEDLEAHKLARADGQWFLEPTFKGNYPQAVLDLLGPSTPQIEPGDMEIINQPIDFLGVNYYFSFDIFNHARGGLFKSRNEFKSAPMWGQTDMGWSVYPPGLKDLLVDIKNTYNSPVIYITNSPVIYITENGTAAPDVPDEKGFVQDRPRVSYLREHFLSVHQAIQEGVDVRGYYVWSLMDNFEWANGYAPRFGIVRVDFDTLERMPKESALWYRGVIERNGVNP